MKISRPESKPLIVILVKRAVFFFFSLCLLIIFLYAVGTIQSFMDQTQLMLLRFSTILGIFLAVGSIYGTILDLWLSFYKHRYRFIKGTFIYAVLIFFGLAVAAASAFIQILAGGNAL